MKIKNIFKKKEKANIKNSGTNNQIIIKTKNQEKIKIEVSGNNNKIIIEENVKISNLKIIIKKDNNKIEIKENVKISGFIELSGSKNKLLIKENTEIGEAKFFIAEQKKVEIGKNCLISRGVIFRTSDMHSIFNKETKQRINHAKDIIIGNKVWINAEVWILKGSNIKDNTIIGARSTTTKEYKKINIIIAGTPAKIIKENIIWDKKYMNDIKI